MSHQILEVYILLTHTNGRSMRKGIRKVYIVLVGTGLKGLCVTPQRR